MALINVEEDIKSSWKNTAGRKKIHYFKLSSFSHLFYQPSPLLNNPVLFKKKTLSSILFGVRMEF